MFALKTDKTQRRHAHCILWPTVFCFYKIQGTQNSRVSRTVSSQDNKKESPAVVWQKEIRKTSSRPGSVTNTLGAQSHPLHFLFCKT